MAGRILIIEDEEDVVELLRINLARRGFDVAVAMTGEEGLDKAAQETPAVILLNVRLPGMNGFDVCRRLREDPRTQGVFIIFVTAAAQQSDYETARSCGADGFLTKPFDMGELLRTIQTALSTAPDASRGAG